MYAYLEGGEAFQTQPQQQSTASFLGFGKSPKSPQDQKLGKSAIFCNVNFPVSSCVQHVLLL